MPSQRYPTSWELITPEIVESQCYNLLDQMEDPYVESYSRYSQRERSLRCGDETIALKNQIDKTSLSYRSAWGTQLMRILTSTTL